MIKHFSDGFVSVAFFRLKRFNYAEIKQESFVCESTFSNTLIQYLNSSEVLCFEITKVIQTSLFNRRKLTYKRFWKVIVNMSHIVGSEPSTRMCNLVFDKYKKQCTKWWKYFKKFVWSILSWKHAASYSYNGMPIVWW